MSRGFDRVAGGIWLLVFGLALGLPPTSSARAVRERVAVEHPKFANGRSREGAFIGYSEHSASDTPAMENRRNVPSWCKDNDDNCASWAASGECDNNPSFMKATCRVSCDSCVFHRKERVREGPRVYLDVVIGDDMNAATGRIVLDLFAGTHPKTSENFRQMCTGEAGFGYRGSTFHRVIPGFMNQAGAKGAGGSIYGGSFDDESFVHNHDEPFLLSMANSGPNTNSNQFFITVAPTPHLDNKHVVFGTVVEGEDVVMAINEAGTNGGRPRRQIHIVDAGELKD